MCMCILIRAHFHLLIDMHAYTGLLKHLHSSIQLPPGTCVAKGVMVKRRPPGLILPGGEELCYMAPGACLYICIYDIYTYVYMHISLCCLYLSFSYHSCLVETASSTVLNNACMLD